MSDAPGEEAEGGCDAERGPQEGRGGGEVRVDAPVEGGYAGHRIGSVQDAAHVCAPTAPSTRIPFSAWNCRATFSLAGPK